MGNTSRIGRIGGLAVGLGIGVVAAMMGTASADSVSADPNDFVFSNAVPGTAAAGESTPDALLNSAVTNLTDANDMLSQIDVSDQPGLDAFISGTTLVHDGALQNLDSLQSAQDTILSNGGSLSELLNQLYLTPLDQEWAQDSAAVLDADQALDAAIASNSGVSAAEFSAVAPDFQLLVDQFESLPVVFLADFF